MPVKGIIDQIRLVNNTKAVTYNVYPEAEQAKADVGDSLMCKMVIRNGGDVVGVVYEDIYIDGLRQGRSGTSLAVGAVWKFGSGFAFSTVPFELRLVAEHSEAGVMIVDDSKTFTVQPYTPTVIPPTPVKHTLSIAVQAGQGTTNPVPGNYEYDEGSTVLVTATPASGYEFSMWTLDGVNRSENPISVLMDVNHTLRAFFTALPPPPPTKRPTAIGIAALPSPIVENQPFTVKGNLYDTSALLYVNVPGKTLHVSYDGVVVGDVATGEAGYSLQVSIPKAGTYRVRVQFDGDVDYLACYHETPEFTVQPAPPPKYSLAVYAREYTEKTSLNVPFKINGAEATTPFAQDLDQGSYTVEMPASFTLGGNLYQFKMWMEDGSVNPTKTVSLNAAMSLMASYTLVPPTPKHSLTLNSTPYPTTFTVNGTSQPSGTPLSLDEGTYVVKAQQFVEDYRFSRWENGDASLERTITLTADTVLTAMYEQIPAPPPEQALLNIESDPSPVTFAVDGNSFNTPYSEALDKGAHVIEMPSIVAVGAEEYRFSVWSDGVATPTRSIDLQQDTSLKAKYTLKPVWQQWLDMIEQGFEELRKFLEGLIPH